MGIASAPLVEKYGIQMMKGLEELFGGAITSIKLRGKKGMKVNT